MGNDLYYKKTPKKEEPKTHLLELSTWHLLADLFCIDKEDIDGTILDKRIIPQLKTAAITAEGCGNMKIANDMHHLVYALKKMKSITLIIRG